MSVAKDLETPKPKDVIFPPGDLYSDEPPLETDLHLVKYLLLKERREKRKDRNFFFLNS